MTGVKNTPAKTSTKYGQLGPISWKPSIVPSSQNIPIDETFVQRAAVMDAIHPKEKDTC